MTLEIIYCIAIHPPEKELNKLSIMLDKKVNTLTSSKKSKKKKKLTTDK